MGRGPASQPCRLRIGKRDFFGRLAPLAAFARTVVATTILLTASGIESYEILANRMGCFFRLRPRKWLVAGDPLRLVYIRLDQARIDRERFASNQPGPMHIATTPSNTRRRASLSRKRSFRARQNTE